MWGRAAWRRGPKVSQLADEGRQPFQKDYTERTVNEAFEKLLNLRSDVDKALEQLAAKSAAPAALRAPAPGAKSAAPPAKTPVKAAKAKPPAEPEIDPGMDFENCLEQIWEQLIATPRTRGRSITTLKLARARILLSSWEVTQLGSEDGPSAEY